MKRRIRWFGVLAMAAVVVLAVCLGHCLIDALTEQSDDVITYTRQLTPGMSAEQVKALFPTEMHWIDEPANEATQNCWMERRYSANDAVRGIAFTEPGIGYRVTTVYFDSEDSLVGVDFSASSGDQLWDEDLRFEGELLQCRNRTLHWHHTESERSNCQQAFEAPGRTAGATGPEVVGEADGLRAHRALSKSIDTTVKIVRNSERIEIFILDKRSAATPDCVLTNADEVAAFTSAFALLEPARPPVPPAAPEYEIRFCGAPDDVAITCSGRFLLSLRGTSESLAVASEYYYQAPPKLAELYRKYWLLYRPQPDISLLGVSATEGQKASLVLQTPGEVLYARIDDTIEGFRIVDVDTAQKRVLLRCTESGREVWVP